MVVFHEGRISSKPQHQFRRLSFCCPRGSHLSYRNCPTLQKTPAKYHHSKGLLDHRLCDLPDFVDSVGGTTASVTQSYRHLRVPKRPFPQSPGGCLRPAPKAQHPRPSWAIWAIWASQHASKTFQTRLLSQSIYPKHHSIRTILHNEEITPGEPITLCISKTFAVFPAAREISVAILRRNFVNNRLTDLFDLRKDGYR